MKKVLFVGLVYGFALAKNVTPAATTSEASEYRLNFKENTSCNNVTLILSYKDDGSFKDEAEFEDAISLAQKLTPYVTQIKSHGELVGCGGGGVLPPSFRTGSNIDLGNKKITSPGNTGTEAQ